MQKLSKEQMIGIAVGIIALILIIVAVAKNNSPKDTTNTNTNSSATTVTSTPTSTPETNTNQPAKNTAVKPAPGKFTYQDMVKKYEGHRFQINDSCQVSPTQTTFSNNTAVMFDNRSPIDRVINLSGKDFTVKAKGWLEMKLTSKTLPNTINISCGGAYNVAKITLQ